MDAREVRAITPDEFASRLEDLKKEQFNLRFQKAGGQLENTRRIREVRRDIARMLTIQTERHPGKDTQ